MKRKKITKKLSLLKKSIVRIHITNSIKGAGEKSERRTNCDMCPPVQIPPSVVPICPDNTSSGSDPYENTSRRKGGESA